MAMAGLGLSGCATVTAEDPPRSDRALPGEEAPKQVVTPVLERPNVGVRKIASQDYELGTYFGTLLVKKSNTLGLVGFRAAYNATDSVFFETRYAFSAGIGANEEKFDNYQSANLAIGYHILPGDLYVSDRYTIPFVIYGIAGAGYAHTDKGFAAYDVGAGIKILTFDRVAVRFEVQDQFFNRYGIDHNAEFSLGLAAYF